MNRRSPLWWMTAHLFQQLILNHINIEERTKILFDIYIGVIKLFYDLKFKDHIHNHPLEDLFYRYWAYYLCEILLIGQSSGHAINMNLCVTLGLH